MNERRAHESVITNFVMKDDELVDLELLPIEMGFGTKIDIDQNGLGHVRLE